MSGEPPRPAMFVHGVQGPVVVVPARVAAYLGRHAGLDRFRQDHRGVDPEVDAVLVALRVAGLAWSSSATGSDPRKSPEVEAPSGDMSTSQVADVVGITERAVRQACAAGRLNATRDEDGRWRITREDLAHYRAGRRAA